MADIDRPAITARIQALIVANGGCAAVARKCDLPLPTVETWHQGRNLPGSVALAKLSRGCEVSAHWILFGRARPSAVRHG